MEKTFEDLIDDLWQVKKTHGCLPPEKLMALVDHTPCLKVQRVERMELLIEAIRDSLHVDTITHALIDKLSDDFDALDIMADAQSSDMVLGSDLHNKTTRATTHLVEMCYTSKAVEPLSEEVLNELSSKAVIHNQACGITGIMYYNETSLTFMQILEGEEKAVRKLMNRISADKRHKEMIIRSKYQIKERSFDGFPMMIKTCQELQKKSQQYSDFSEWMSDELHISNSNHVSKSAQWLLGQIRATCLHHKTENALAS